MADDDGVIRLGLRQVPLSCAGPEDDPLGQVCSAHRGSSKRWGIRRTALDPGSRHCAGDRPGLARDACNRRGLHRCRARSTASQTAPAPVPPRPGDRAMLILSARPPAHRAADCGDRGPDRPRGRGRAHDPAPARSRGAVRLLGDGAGPMPRACRPRRGLNGRSSWSCPRSTTPRQALLAEMHGRMGCFPPVVRLRPSRVRFRQGSRSQRCSICKRCAPLRAEKRIEERRARRGRGEKTYGTSGECDFGRRDRCRDRVHRALGPGLLGSRRMRRVWPMS